MIKDLYDKLMGRIHAKYGSDIPSTVEKLEKKPEQKQLPPLLAVEMEEAGADKDAELLELAREITEKLQGSAKGGSVFNVQNCEVGMQGDHQTNYGGIHFGSSKKE